MADPEDEQQKKPEKKIEVEDEQQKKPEKKIEVEDEQQKKPEKKIEVEDEQQKKPEKKIEIEDEQQKKPEKKIEVIRPTAHVCETHDEPDEECMKRNPVGVERKLVKNGGVTKTVVKPGTCSCSNTPLYGDEVTVHYTGTLADGTVFESTRDEEPFKFRMGLGRVIKGWEKGVKTMKKGERAIFVVQPEYAYGKEGRPPAIAPDTPLTFDIELLSWCSVKDVTNDGGVIKKVIREGKSWETPKAEDEVTVKYEAKLKDGTLISKSPDEGVRFIVQEGWFCPAVTHAVKTMKIEEFVQLTVLPQYGFAEEGREAKECEGAVPPNATLMVDLEMVSWNTVEEVTDDKRIIKKVTKKGEGYEKPNPGSTVTVKYVGALSDGTIFEKKGLHPEQPITLHIDADEVVLGLDETLASMKKGEVCIVQIPPEYGFGDEEKQSDLTLVPANATLTYEIEMISFVKAKDSWDLEASEKLVAAAKKKEEGNDLFKKGKLFHAALKFEKGARFVEYNSVFADGDEKAEAKSLRNSLKLNDAACKLKLNSFPEVVELTTKVLETDSLNVKALFRRAQARSALMDLDLAEQDLKRVLGIDPENRDAKLEQKRLNAKQAAHRKKEAKVYGNMFERMIKMDEKESKKLEIRLGKHIQDPAQENPAHVSVQG